MNILNKRVRYASGQKSFSSMLKKDGRRLKCAYCKGDIDKTSSYYKENDDTYHTKCLTCHTCKQDCSSEFYLTYNKINNYYFPVIYCKKDMNEICVACNEPIENGGLVTFQDQKYHADHFTCSECATSLCNKDTVFEFKKKLYCTSDFLQVYGAEQLFLDTMDDGDESRVEDYEVEDEDATELEKKLLDCDVREHKVMKTRYCGGCGTMLLTGTIVSELATAPEKQYWHVDCVYLFRKYRVVVNPQFLDPRKYIMFSKNCRSVNMTSELRGTTNAIKGFLVRGELLLEKLVPETPATGFSASAGGTGSGSGNGNNIGVAGNSGSGSGLAMPLPVQSDSTSAHGSVHGSTNNSAAASPAPAPVSASASAQASAHASASASVATAQMQSPVALQTQSPVAMVTASPKMSPQVFVGAEEAEIQRHSAKAYLRSLLRQLETLFSCLQEVEFVIGTTDIDTLELSTELEKLNIVKFQRLDNVDTDIYNGFTTFLSSKMTHRDAAKFARMYKKACNQLIGFIFHKVLKYNYLMKHNHLHQFFLEKLAPQLNDTPQDTHTHEQHVCENCSRPIELESYVVQVPITSIGTFSLKFHIGCVDYDDILFGNFPFIYDVYSSGSKNDINPESFRTLYVPQHEAILDSIAREIETVL